MISTDVGGLTSIGLKLLETFTIPFLQVPHEVSGRLLSGLGNTSVIVGVILLILFLPCLAF
jgi:hypothetical protein